MPALSLAVPFTAAVTVHFVASIAVPPNESTSVATGGVTPGGAVMVIDRLVECEGTPPGYCPLTVKVPETPVPAGSVVNVSVELPPAITVGGLKDAPVTPGGRPAVESEIVCTVPDVATVWTA